MMKAIGYIFLISLVVMGCSENMNRVNVHKDSDNGNVKIEAMEVLKNKRVFFGHASVGYNIIDGIMDIAAKHELGQNIIIKELKGTYEVSEPAIYHAKNGKNRFPKGKVDAFKNSLENNRLGSKLDVAFFKFCYVDFNRDTNVQELFDYYVKNMEDIKRDFPGLKLIHVTTPLYVHAKGLKGFVKNLVKGDISNVKRNQFNTLLINKYKNIDPIYDLAKVESMHPDGSRESFKYKGETYFSLAEQYSHDGGHLNETGRFYAAKELLNTLSAVNKDSNP